MTIKIIYMREPNYQEAFSHSWQMVKEHKILWVFGLLSVCLGQWGVAHFLGGLNLAGLNQYDSGFRFYPALAALVYFAASGIIPFLLAGWLLTVVAAVVVLAIFVAVSARGALIAAVGHWFAKDGKMSLSLVWRHGVRNFWKLLTLVVLTRLLETALLVLSVYAFATVGDNAGGFVLQALFGALILAVGVSVEAVMIFASGYAVIDGAGVVNSIARGWRLFSRHILVTLELGVLLMILSVVAALLVLLAGFLVFIPALIVWMLAIVSNLDGLLAFGFILAWTLFVVALGFIAAIFNAFNTSAWMYLFVKMHRENYVGWLLHKIKKLFVK